MKFRLSLHCFTLLELVKCSPPHPALPLVSIMVSMVRNQWLAQCGHVVPRWLVLLTELCIWLQYLAPPASKVLPSSSLPLTGQLHA